MVRVTAVGADGAATGEREWFLIDTGADRSALSADLVKRLNLQPANGSTINLQGISGGATFILVSAVLEFVTTAGGPVRVRGNFAAFVDAAATDFSILGRDVLDNFDLIVARQRGNIRLLAPNHHYHVSGP
jgi:hypothetical protein